MKLYIVHFCKVSIWYLSPHMCLQQGCCHMECLAFTLLDGHFNLPKLTWLRTIFDFPWSKVQFSILFFTYLFISSINFNTSLSGHSEKGVHKNVTCYDWLSIESKAIRFWIIYILVTERSVEQTSSYLSPEGYKLWEIRSR